MVRRKRITFETVDGQERSFLVTRKKNNRIIKRQEYSPMRCPHCREYIYLKGLKEKEFYEDEVKDN